MRLALLGCDDEWKAFLRDLPREHQLVAVFEAEGADLPLCALLPDVQRSASWETLLVRDDIDVILVASPPLRARADGFDPQALRIDQLKKLAQAGRALLVSHPAADLLDAYEIEMLRREGGGQLEPWFPGLNRPWLDLWKAWELDTSPAGQIKIEWQRQVKHDSANAVQIALVRDLLLIERLVGKLARVTALGVGSPRAANASWRMLSVQIESAAGTTIRWTTLPRTRELAARVAVVSGERDYELQVSSDIAAPWQVRDSVNSWDGNETRDTLAWFERGEHLTDADAANAWLEACRSLETLAAVTKSLDRARTIELSATEQTEEHQFKGVMASAGCLVLMLILFALGIAALVEGLQLPLRNSPIWRMWPVLLILLTVCFLAMQFLQGVIQKPAENQAPRDSAG